MTVKWSRSAIADLADARRYVERDNPEAAQGLAKRILDAADTVAKSPGIGRPGRVANTREFVIRRTHYLLVYRTRRKVLELLRVLHERRRWPPSRSTV